jgi:alkyl hydroperoxide reductase subunit AhpC
MSDLFPERLPEHSYPVSHSSIPARDLLVILDHELTVVVLILNDIVTGRTVNESQLQRLCQAAARIGKARDMANPAKWSRHAA